MWLVLCLAALTTVYCVDDSKYTPPKVQVYSYEPGQYGMENILICQVSGFHPPDITIQLMKNGMELPGAKQTDLAFKQDWHFHLTKHVAVKPMSEDKYSCKVTHGEVVKDYAWEPNM